MKKHLLLGALCLCTMFSVAHSYENIFNENPELQIDKSKIKVGSQG